MGGKLKPILIGGVAFGLLSSIPFINLPNACCCAWAVGGGLLAAYFFSKDSLVPITPADSAIIGALTGVVGGIVYFVVGVPLGLIIGTTMAGVFITALQNVNPQQAAEISRIILVQESSLPTQILFAVISGIMWIVLFIIFSTLGGLLGSVLFGKKTNGHIPPPSQWP
ncbi:MAG: hypothetical protein ACRD4L_04645 [Pyrinomonadaceae bacterium]